MKKEIAYKVIEFLRNVVNGFIGYIFCVFGVVGMFYIHYLSGNMPVTVYSETDIGDLIIAIGYLFFMLKVMISITEAINSRKWYCLLFEIAAAIVVLSVLYLVPEIIHWICTAGINGNFWLIVGLFVTSIVLKYILRFLDKDHGIQNIVVSHVSMKDKE